MIRGYVGFSDEVAFCAGGQQLENDLERLMEKVECGGGVFLCGRYQGSTDNLG